MPPLMKNRKEQKSHTQMFCDFNRPNLEITNKDKSVCSPQLLKHYLHIYLTYLSPESHFANLAQCKMAPMKNIQLPDSLSQDKQMKLV